MILLINRIVSVWWAGLRFWSPLWGSIPNTTIAVISKECRQDQKLRRNKVRFLLTFLCPTQWGTNENLAPTGCASNLILITKYKKPDARIAAESTKHYSSAWANISEGAQKEVDIVRICHVGVSEKIVIFSLGSLGSAIMTIPLNREYNFHS